MAAGLNAGLQSAEFDGEKQQVHRLGDRRGVGIVEITAGAVEAQRLPLIPPDASAVRQDQDAVFAQGLCQQLRVQDAQRAKADDARGFDLFHKDTSQ